MIRISIFFLALLILGGWAFQPPYCIRDIQTLEIKQQQLNHFVDTINKPINIGFKSTEGLIDDRDLKYLGMLPHNEPFSVFDERYYKEAMQILKLLLKAIDFDHFMATAEALHDRVNDDLLYYCLSVAVLHRNDTYGIRITPVHYVYPDKFLKINVIQKMKEVAKAARSLSQPPIIDTTEDSINYLNPNNDLDYFLEDIAMNSAHHQWHVNYPAIWWQKGDIDRKGELFYWMHKQMVNRYDAERLSNYKTPVKPFNNWDEPIREGYAPHLRIDKLGYRYSYRPPYVTLKNLKDMTKTKMMLWEERLKNAALRGFVRTINDTIVDLDNEHGINILGEMVEASMLSVNRKYYGNLHSYAHVIAGKITDAKDVHDGKYGAMYDVSTSARDPLFYAWHKYVNRIFETHKDHLPPYTKDELDFPGVTINKVAINGTEGNVVQTFWQTNIFKVPQGFTFTGKTSIGVKVKHLQHEDFKYNIEVENSGPPKEAIVRIYAVPYVEGYNNVSFNQVRKTLIELDIFVTKLEAGKNVIVRRSVESNIVKPIQEIFSDYGRFWPTQHCQCAWPAHLLLPKGNRKGMKFGLAVVINDWEKEKVGLESCFCQKSGTYCDIGRKISFKKALGFPFDRKANVNSFKRFKTPNMGSTIFNIKFVGERFHGF